MVKKVSYMILGFIACLLTSVPAYAKAVTDTVVLLHGIGRSELTMAPIETYLRFQGYRTVNIGYASREKTIDELVNDVHVHLKNVKIDKRAKLHFIGYSMGGLLADAYIRKYKPANLGRVVMVGTPNQGSEVADYLSQYEAYKDYFGPAGIELQTARKAKAADYEVGVIAGSMSVDPISSLLLIPGPDDGKVAVDRTKLPKMKDHITLSTTHVFMMNNPFVIKQAANFIRDGYFDHGRPAVDGSTYNQ